MTYQMTEADWIELAKEFRANRRSLQEQFDSARALITALCNERDALVGELGVVERQLAIVTMKLGLIGGVMAELHKADKAAT